MIYRNLPRKNVLSPLSSTVNTNFGLRMDSPHSLLLQTSWTGNSQLHQGWGFPRFNSHLLVVSATFWFDQPASISCLRENNPPSFSIPVCFVLSHGNNDNKKTRSAIVVQMQRRTLCRMSSLSAQELQSQPLRLSRRSNPVACSQKAQIGWNYCRFFFRRDYDSSGWCWWWHDCGDNNNNDDDDQQ